MREAAASAALMAGCIGGVSLAETVVVEPVRALAPAAFIRESDAPDLDTNGQPYLPLDGPKPKERPVRTYPVRRSYGRGGQIGNRTRGDIRSGWLR